jgi:hypothetical protein
MNSSKFTHRYPGHHDTAIWKAAFIAFALAALFSSRTAYGGEEGDEPFRIGEVIRQQREIRKADREVARQAVFQENERQIFVPAGPRAACPMPAEEINRC